MTITLQSLRERASGLNRRVAVACAHDEDVLKAVIMAADAHICTPTLFGDERRIRSILSSLGANHKAFHIVEPGDGGADASAEAAIQAVIDCEADFLMKGAMSTSDLLKHVVRSPLVQGIPLSHTMIFEVPAYGKLLVNTDGGMNPAPDLARKKAILENAAVLLKTLGYDAITTACVSGSEVVSEKIPSTMDAKALAEMDWSRYNMEVYGPVGLDLAISEQARVHKGYNVPGAKDADILLMPNYETANCFGKALTYFAGARSAGLVVGARCPIVLVSRADPAETKLSSLALGAIAAKGETT